MTKYKGYQYYFNSEGAMLKKFTPSFMDQITCWQRALQRIKEVYPELSTKVESILVVAVLLVVGKISELDSNVKKEYQEEEKRCYHIFMEHAKKKEIQKYLPKGYPLKVFLYRFFPKLYIFLYGQLKRR